jgi:hypothetical protein
MQKKKKARKYNVVLFAGRPREKGMGFVDEAEQLSSVIILSDIMPKTLNLIYIDSSLS